MLSTTLILTFLFAPRPATFVLEVEASRFTEHTVLLNGEPIRPGLYRTEPLHGSVEVEIEVRYNDDGEIIRRVHTVTLTGGNVHRILITVPRVYPKMAIT